MSKAPPNALLPKIAGVGKAKEKIKNKCGYPESNGGRLGHNEKYEPLYYTHPNH